MSDEVLSPAAEESPAAEGSAAPTSRMRTRLARIGSKTSTDPVLEPLFRIVRNTHPKADLSVDREGLQDRRAPPPQPEAHQRRPVHHPSARGDVDPGRAGHDAADLCAALLHDTVEDTAYTLEQLTRDFDEEVAQLVDGVTKLDKVKHGDSAQAETIRKMIVAMSKDIRVLVIKLADRLHNMRTLRYLRQDKQERIAGETLEIYAPLAHRLGMNTVKWELEDLAFATLHPKVYDEIVRLVAERAPARDEFLASVIDQVQGDLRAAKIKATVTGRPKHYYSIYQKMIVRGREFTDIYDLVGIRVLTETLRDCYAVLGVLHARWNPVAGRFKDFVAMPKFNMYQSLHTTVIGPGGKPVELQIRTFGMHRRAEYGVAAHWKYKEDGRAGVDTDRKLATTESAQRRHGLGPPADGLAEGDRGSGGVPRVTAVRDQLRRGLRLHAAWRGRRAADRLDTGRLRVRHPHRGRPSLHRCPGQQPAGAAGVRARQRRRGRGLHVQGAERRPEPRLADLRQEPASAQQDQAVLHQGAPRGSDRAGQGRARPTDASRGSAAAADADARDAVGGRLGASPLRCHRAVRRGRRGQHDRADRGQADPRAVRRRGRRRRGRRDRHDHHRARAPQAITARRRGCHRQGPQRRLGQAGALLYSGAGRRDHRLRHDRAPGCRCTGSTAPT